EPVSVDKEHKRQESVNGDFGDDIGVEAVAEIDRVDVIAVDSSEISKRDKQRGTKEKASLRSFGVMYGSEGVHRVPFQIAVHDREKNLEEEIDGIYKHRE